MINSVYDTYRFDVVPGLDFFKSPWAILSSYYYRQRSEDGWMQFIRTARSTWFFSCRVKNEEIKFVIDIIT